MGVLLLSVSLGLLLFVYTASGHLCPRGPFVCPEATTCCPLSEGEYGCCPMENAVCCRDFSHCCPNGTVCDTKAMRCIREDGTSMKMKTKLKKGFLVEGFFCPDRQSKCPEGSTCCALQDGHYGCCPLPNAVCCSDHLHCCPSGTQCDAAEGRCLKPEDGSFIQWFTKLKAVDVKSKAAINTKPSWLYCEDGRKCLGLSKCCSDQQGNSYCCPLKNGVCCSDGRHCCPHGFQCDAEEGRCTKDNAFLSVALLWTENSDSDVKVVKETITCEDGSKCPSTSKCCPLNDYDPESTAYGCCPMHEGICCGLTCCPKGYRCAAGVRCEKSYRTYFYSYFG